MYMTPPEAAKGLWELFYLPDHNADQTVEDFADLSRYPVFSNRAFDGNSSGFSPAPNAVQQHASPGP